jgi:hypothetical protein
MDFDLGRAQNEAQSHSVNLRFCSALSAYAPPPPDSACRASVARRSSRARGPEALGDAGVSPTRIECAIAGEGWSHRFRPVAKGTAELTEKNFRWENIFCRLLFFWEIDYPN